MTKPHEIIVCMGSSCFSRGNKSILPVIQAFLEEHELNSDVNVKGSLCEGNCKQGPNIVIDSQAYHAITPTKVLQILRMHLLQEKPTQATNDKIIK